MKEHEPSPSRLLQTCHCCDESAKTRDSPACTIISTRSGCDFSLPSLFKMIDDVPRLSEAIYSIRFCRSAHQRGELLEMMPDRRGDRCFLFEGDCALLEQSTFPLFECVLINLLALTKIASWCVLNKVLSEQSDFVVRVKIPHCLAHGIIGFEDTIPQVASPLRIAAAIAAIRMVSVSLRRCDQPTSAVML